MTAVWPSVLVEYTSPVYPLLHVAHPWPTSSWSSGVSPNPIVAPVGAITSETASVGCGSSPNGVIVYGPRVDGGAPVPGDPSNAMPDGGGFGGGMSDSGTHALSRSRSNST